MFMLNKNKVIQSKMNDYFMRVQQSLLTFQEAIEYWFEHGIDSRFRTFFDDAHVQESKADDIREDIDVMLYAKTLLPESRREILTLLERMDHIPNCAESILNQIETQMIVLPETMHGDLRELVRISLEAYHLVMEAAREALGANRHVMVRIEEVDHKESVCDKIEQKLIRELFRGPLDKADKILIRDIVLQMGDISDYCENVANFLKIFHIKRQV